jgi:hypothetical protein
MLLFAASCRFNAQNLLETQKKTIIFSPTKKKKEKKGYASSKAMERRLSRFFE